MSNVKILLFIITLTLGPLNNYGRPQFVAGNLDLESTDREISLSGEWLSLDESGDPAGYVRFPHPGKATLPKSGKYRISLSSAVPGEKMLLRTDSLTGIHAFFIDDLYIGRKGVSGSTAAPLPFTVPAKEFTITVEVSDSHQTISDPRGSIYLTTPELYNRRMQIMGMEEFIFQGILFSAIIIYTSMYFLGRKRKEYLYFALMNTGLSLWIFANNSIIHSFFPLLGQYILSLRISLFALTGALLFYYLFSCWYRGKPQYPRIVRASTLFLGTNLLLIVILPDASLPALGTVFLCEVLFCFVMLVLVTLKKMKIRAIHPLGFFPGFIFLNLAIYLRFFIVSPEIDDILLRTALIILVMQQIIYHTYLSLISYNRIRELNRDYIKLNRDLKNSLSRIEDQSELIHYISSRDSSTGLPNKNQFTAVFQREMTRLYPKDILQCFAMVEWEDFKRVLHRRGLRTQTEFIRIMADRANQFCSEREWVCRYSDDRFLFILPLREEEAPRKTEALRRLFGTPIRKGDEEYTPKVHLGYTLVRESSIPQETLMRQLFAALDYAKKQKTGTPCCFNRSIDIFQMEKVRLEAKLKQALKRGALDIYYQPQHESWQYAVTGMEALMRWNDPDLGRVPPDEFIPLAEELGLMEEIDLYTLKKVLKQLKKWEKTELEDIRISLNISPSNFVNSDFIEKLIARTELREIDPSRLELELTETVLVYNHNQLKRNIGRLKEKGFTIALDDFGTGYSSLAYLSDFPVDVLKIDKAFVMNLLQDDRKMGIVNSIIAIGRALGMRIISEGVEEEEVLHYLRKAGSHTIQGYFFSPALSSARIKEYVRKSCTA